MLIAQDRRRSFWVGLCFDFYNYFGLRGGRYAGRVVAGALEHGLPIFRTSPYEVHSTLP